MIPNKPNNSYEKNKYNTYAVQNFCFPAALHGITPQSCGYGKIK